MEKRRFGIKPTLSNRKSTPHYSRSIKLASNIKSKEAQTPNTGTTIQEPPYSLSSHILSESMEIKSRRARSRVAQSIFDQSQVMINCLGQFDIHIGNKADYLNFQHTLRKVLKNGKKSIIYDLHFPPKDRKGCWDINCPTRKKWLANMIFIDRQLNLLKEIDYTLPIPEKIAQQIHKDIPRSFPDNMFPKTKLTIYHAATQKMSLYETLKNVLHLYVLYDKQLGYAQGINLVAAVVVIHMKEVDISFIYLKEIMTYGNLRSLYINDFQKVKEASQYFFHSILPEILPDLFDQFERCNVQPLMLIPSYYLNLFSSIVDIHYMHIIIDQFMLQGLNFLHKLMLSILSFIKNDLLLAQQQTIILLGASSLKQRNIPWQKVLAVTQGIILPQKRR